MLSVGRCQYLSVVECVFDTADVLMVSVLASLDKGVDVPMLTSEHRNLSQVF